MNTKFIRDMVLENQEFALGEIFAKFVVTLLVDFDVSPHPTSHRKIPTRRYTIVARSSAARVLTKVIKCLKRS